MTTQGQLLHSIPSTLQYLLERSQLWPLPLPPDHTLHLLDVTPAGQLIGAEGLPSWLASLAQEVARLREGRSLESPQSAVAEPLYSHLDASFQGIAVLVGPSAATLMPPLSRLLEHVTVQEYELDESTRLIQDAFDQIVFLLQASSLVTSGKTLREILHQILQAGMGLLQADGGAILFADPTVPAILVNAPWGQAHRLELFALVANWRIPQCCEFGGLEDSEDVGPAADTCLDRLAPALRGRIRSLTGVSVGLGEEAEIGFLLFNRREGGGFRPGDREMMSFLAQQIATVLRREHLAARQRLEQELEVAQQFYHAILPDTLPSLPGGSRMAVYSQPAWDVGGDFHWISEVKDDELYLVLGDAAGKGLPSAFIMGQSVTILRSVAHLEGWTPARMLGHAQDLLMPTLRNAELLITAVVGRLNVQTGRYLYADAGHGYSFLRRARTGEVKRLPATGIPLGPMQQDRFVNRAVELEPGDQLLIVSDGFVEAMAPNLATYGVDRLMGFWGMLPLVSPGRSLQRLVGSVWQLVERVYPDRFNRQDDLTALLLQYRPPREQQPDVQQVSRRFQGTLAQIPRFMDWIRGVAMAVTGWSLAEQHNFALATMECFTNIVRHAYRGGSLQGPITVSVKAHRGIVRFRCRDTGAPFPSGKGNSWQQAAPPRISPHGGYGLFVMNRLADRVHYSRRHRVNTWQMLFARPQDRAPSESGHDLGTPFFRAELENRILESEITQ